jgi:hypothetical protein
MHYLGKQGLFLILESEEEGVEFFDTSEGLLCCGSTPQN